MGAPEFDAALDAGRALQPALAALAAQLVPGGSDATGVQRMVDGGAGASWRFEIRTDDDDAAGTRPPGLPVPRIVLVLRPEHGLGEGFIMEQPPGETHGASIATEAGLAAARRALAYQCGLAAARIHGIATESLPSLRMAPAPAELARLLALHRGHGRPSAVFDRAFQWLQRNVPPTPALPALVHGDFRNGNLVVGPAGLRALLGWELAHLGDPMEDLACLCVSPGRFGRKDLPVGGFGTRADLLAGYEAGGGRADAPRLRYWELMGTLRQGVQDEALAPAGDAGRAPGVESELLDLLGYGDPSESC